MIDPTQQALQNGAVALEGASRQARTWVKRLARSAVSVGNEEDSLVEATMRAENLARKLAGSSQRRSSAGVFGPSQAGKSYLVSVLGRTKGQPLIADFAGDERNFIQDINPAGGKESTGLVTRFTAIPGTRDSSHPVELRLLTETDLVKILGNSFLSDFDQNKRELKLPPADKVRATIGKLESQAGPPAAHLDEVRMFDIGEYFKLNYPTTIGPLTDGGYWEALIRFGHRLPIRGRIELYSQLWAGVPEVTRIFTLMLEALERLGQVPNARAAIESLVPRERSIIDVDIVQHGLGTEADRTDLISVVPERADGSDSASVQVSRATLCALVAELKIVMKSQPWAFFEHTDMLDFPGARSREHMVNLSTDDATRAAEVRNMVRRGKVSYLFQRYTEERELACMLLCMPPKPAEVKDLTGLVRFWIGHTHGDNPAARAALPCALFFVLTWFDEELRSKPGDKPDAIRNRIEARLESSMYGLYGHEDWLQNWSNGVPFNNTYFLRNPEFPLDGVFEYEGPKGNRREIGIAEEARDQLASTRSGVIAGEKSSRHFADPGQAWDQAVAFNDGGVSHLVANLDRVLSPKLKTRQMVGRLVDQAKQLDTRLRRFYQADDDASRKDKEDALMLLRRRLAAAAKAQGFRNFVHLLQCMMLTETEVRAAFLNVGSMKSVAAAPPPSAAAAPVPAPVDDEDDFFESAMKAPAAGTTAAPPPPPPRQRDRYDDFALRLINLWTDRVRGLATRTAALAALGFESQHVGDVGNELVIAAHRLNLGQRIADNVRSQVAASNLRWDDAADRSAGLATTMVNDHVAYLGYGGLPADKRPGYPEPPQVRTRAVFEAPPIPAPGKIPDLGAQRLVLESTYFLDWGVSLKQLGLDNVSFLGGREIDEKDNRMLGEILTEIVPVTRVSAD